MTADCPTCAFEGVCTDDTKHEKQVSPNNCTQYAPDQGILSKRNWT